MVFLFALLPVCATKRLICDGALRRVIAVGVLFFCVPVCGSAEEVWDWSTPTPCRGSCSWPASTSAATYTAAVAPRLARALVAPVAAAWRVGLSRGGLGGVLHGAAPAAVLALLPPGGEPRELLARAVSRAVMGRGGGGGGERLKAQAAKHTRRPLRRARATRGTGQPVDPLVRPSLWCWLCR